MAITSVIIHCKSNIYTNILDKISIISIIYYGLDTTYDKCIERNNLITLLCAISIFLFNMITIYLFYGGYIYNRYCYDEDNNIARKWHILLHIITCISHHMVDIF